MSIIVKQLLEISSVISGLLHATHSGGTKPFSLDCKTNLCLNRRKIDALYKWPDDAQGAGVFQMVHGNHDVLLMKGATWAPV